MYGINFINEDISYKYCIQETVEEISLLIEKEYMCSLYFESLLKNALEENDKQIINSILEDEKYHIETLKKLYLDLTGKNHLCSLHPTRTSNNYRNAVILALLDKFKIVKTYNSIFQSLFNEKQKAIILKIINDEFLHIGELNFMLLDKNG